MRYKQAGIVHCAHNEVDAVAVCVVVVVDVVEPADDDDGFLLWGQERRKVKNDSTRRKLYLHTRDYSRTVNNQAASRCRHRRGAVRSSKPVSRSCESASRGATPVNRIGAYTGWSGANPPSLSGRKVVNSVARSDKALDLEMILGDASRFAMKTDGKIK